MKLKVSQILMLLNVLTNAKLSKTTAQDKAAIIKLTVALRKEAKAWNDLVEEARKHCAPENIDELMEEQKKLDTLETEERKAVEEAIAIFNAELDKVLRPEFESEKETGIAPFDDDAIVSLADSNPEWTLGDILAVRDCLSGPEAEGK